MTTKPRLRVRFHPEEQMYHVKTSKGVYLGWFTNHSYKRYGSTQKVAFVSSARLKINFHTFSKLWEYQHRRSVIDAVKRMLSHIPPVPSFHKGGVCPNVNERTVGNYEEQILDGHHRQRVANELFAPSHNKTLHYINPEY